MGALVCAALLFPGTWSAAWRERVLTAYAPGYAEERWLDEILKPNDVVLTGPNSTLFLPRPFVVEDRFDGLRSPEDDRRELQWLERDAGVSVATVESDIQFSPALAAAMETGAPIGPAMTFLRAHAQSHGSNQPEFELQAARLLP